MIAFRWLVPLAFLSVSVLGSPPPDAGSCRPEVRAFREAEMARAARRIEALSHPEKYGVQPSQDLDILETHLDLFVDPENEHVSGTVTLTFVPTATLARLDLRLHRALSLGGTALDGSAVAFRRKKDKVSVDFSPPLAAGKAHALAVSYSGRPQVTGTLGGGMFFSRHDGVASATTLSEPFDSFAWWPCVDDLADKSLARIDLTVPPGMVGASNGSLADVEPNPDGTTTYRWVESYPISNYLISANVTNYSQFGDLYTALDGITTMPLQHFVYPEDLHRALVNFSVIPEMITFMAQMCGEYPFLGEKYGMVAFPWGGGMEHQTLTSVGDRFVGGSGSYGELYLHELAHQWWGDDVTCGTWNDVWLNEGFATYFEALWLAREENIPMGRAMAYFDDGQYDGYLRGSPYLRNGNTAFADTGAIYDKGAWVLHMLRRVVGDGAFFDALRAYRAAHAYGNATTEDLRAAFEGEWGGDLSWFFDQWVYTVKRPIYRLRWSQEAGASSGFRVVVTLEQRQPHKVARRTTRRDVYLMPLDLILHFEDGTSEIRTVWNDQRVQSFDFDVPKAVASVGLDEENYVLKVLQ
ncbi:MAG: M1 family metallopeptidase [Acidobacteriota bacterium]